MAVLLPFLAGRLPFRYTQMRFEIFFHLVKAGEPIKINNFNEYPRKGVTLCLLPAKNLEEVHTIAQVADNPLHLMMIQTHYLLALNVMEQTIPLKFVSTVLPIFIDKWGLQEHLDIIDKTFKKCVK